MWAPRSDITLDEIGFTDQGRIERSSMDGRVVCGPYAEIGCRSQQFASIQVASRLAMS